MGPGNDQPLTPAAPPPPGAPTPPSAIPPAPAADISAAPVPPPAGPIGESKPEVTHTGGGSKKPMLIALILVLVIAILGVGGFLAYQQFGSPAAAPETQEQEQPANLTNDLQELNTEIQDIEISDPADDLMEIDKQINSIDASASPSASAKASPKTSASPAATR